MYFEEIVGCFLLFVCCCLFVVVVLLWVFCFLFVLLVVVVVLNGVFFQTNIAIDFNTNISKIFLYNIMC